MRKLVALVWVLLLVGGLAVPQAKASDPPVYWAKTYGGSGDDRANAVAIAPNGDVIVAGDGLLRLSPEGELKWAKELDGEDIKVFPDGTAATAKDNGADFRVVRFNVDEVPNYLDWWGWCSSAVTDFTTTWTKR